MIEVYHFQQRNVNKLQKFVTYCHEIGRNMLDFAQERRYYKHIRNKKLQKRKRPEMKNMPQVTKGQMINTPHGIGFVSFVWPMSVGHVEHQCAYFVYLISPRPSGEAFPIYEAHELRSLNTGIYFPAHRGEILR